VTDSSSGAALFVATARAFFDKRASLAHVRALHADDLSSTRLGGGVPLSSAGQACCFLTSSGAVA
jgi:hypothetical protein